MGRKDVNTITVTGRVEVEPEMRFTADGVPHTTFSLVCAQPTPRDPHAFERFRLVAWDEPLAEQCNDLLPGARVLVEGRLQSTSSDDPEDRARCLFELIVRDLVMLASTHSAIMPASQQHPQEPATRPTISPAPARSAPAATAAPSSSRTAPAAPPRIPRGPRRAS